MTDFASSAMVRVLLRGMQRNGLQLPASVQGVGFPTATVSLDFKRDIIQEVIRQSGPQCLVTLGQGIHDFAHEPTHRALCLASSPQELIERWQRLERYIHSRHRTEQVNANRDSLTVRHVALSGFPAPSAYEDLVVAGVLAALIELIGASGLQLMIDRVPVYPTCSLDELLSLSAEQTTAEWTFVWRSITRQPHAYPLAESPAALISHEPWPEIAKRVFVAFASDPMAPPDLKELASGLSTSARSLQRALALAGLSYSTLLGQSRLRLASRALLESTTSIAEIGLLCGYADQAHFTREFGSRVGLTPARYREAFVPRARLA